VSQVKSEEDRISEKTTLVDAKSLEVGVEFALTHFDWNFTVASGPSKLKL
jgi:hypothetical protein